MTTNRKALNVLMVSARYFPYIGGVETHVYEVAWRLAKAGIQVTVLTTDVSGELPPKEELRGVQIIRVPAWPSNKDYYLAPNIYRVIAQGHWDLVHCQGYHTLVAPLAMFAAWRAKRPYVVTFHSGGDSSSFRKAFRGFQSKALRPLLANADRLIGPSIWEVEFFRAQLHLPKEQFVVVPNGAHHLSQSTNSKQKTTDSKLIVSIGRLERYKGHQRVIAALPKVREQIPDVRLRIVGVGSYESNLRQMVKKLGVAEYVEIGAVPPGDSDGMASIIGRANLVTLLSEHEAQGIAVLEALSLQRPVLVAGTTALQEFADQGLARAVPLKSRPEEVATAVIEQLREPLIPTNVKLPTWNECAADLLDLYESILGKLSCTS